MPSFGLTGIGALLSGGDIAGSTADIYGKDKVFGKKAKIADVTPVDLQAEQKRAADSNLANADSIDALLNRLIPNWSEMVKKGTGNALSLLKGEIPKDVQEQIGRSTAYQSFQGGYGGSGMSHALVARDLGRTSLDLQQLGSNSAQQWSKIAESVYAPFTITTGQQAVTTATNNALMTDHQQRVNNMEAAPDPAAAAMYAINSAIGMKLLDFGMGAAGGAMGGGGGGGGGGQQGGGWSMSGGQGNSPAWQYNSSTGQYMQVPQATSAWGSYSGGG